MCRVWVVVCVGRVSGLRLVLCVGFGGGVYRVLWWCVGSWLCVFLCVYEIFLVSFRGTYCYNPNRL